MCSTWCKCQVLFCVSRSLWTGVDETTVFHIECHCGKQMICMNLFHLRKWVTLCQDYTWSQATIGMFKNGRNMGRHGQCCTLQIMWMTFQWQHRDAWTKTQQFWMPPPPKKLKYKILSQFHQSSRPRYTLASLSLKQTKHEPKVKNSMLLLLLLLPALCGQLWNGLALVSEEQEMEVSGRMCVSHALRPLSPAVMWSSELAACLHCHSDAERGGWLGAM